MPLQNTQPATARAVPRILVVDDDPAIAEFFADVLGGHVRCEVYRAASVDEARDVLNCEGIELLVTDLKLPDGDGLELLDELRDRQPLSSAVVISGDICQDRAVEAMRLGALDYLAKPFNATQVIDRVSKALMQQQIKSRRERRMLKLKDAVRKLNAARKTVNKKVDLLCNDLIGAYGELSRQMDHVRIQESYRQFIQQAANLEQLLCHTMDWLLRQVGYCNIGIWLTSSDSELQLGAYMKYTMPAETDLTEALQKNLLRVAMRRGFVRLCGPEAKSTLTPAEMKHLSAQDIVSINCTYLGETLGVMTLFRDEKTPFSDDDVNAMKLICPIFALALAKATRGSEGDGGGGGESDDIGPQPAGPEDQDLPEPKPRRKKDRKSDPADWWKTGETPPF